MGAPGAASWSRGMRGHLVVETLSGYKNGKVRQHGELKRIY